LLPLPPLPTIVGSESKSVNGRLVAVSRTDCWSEDVTTWLEDAGEVVTAWGGIGRGAKGGSRSLA